MKNGLYFRLAWTGIRKNKTLYVPYLLTCVLMVAVFYILCFLSRSDLLENMAAGTSLGFVLNLGSFVIGAFSVLFLFYTNSFLIRRRKKEFGLYHVLGMDKGNISRVLVRETLIVAVISLGLGLCIGVALSKLAELGLCKIVGLEASFRFSFSLDSACFCAEFYGVIFLLILLNSLRQVRFSNPAELLKSENMGEKPPKANWVLGLLGLALLGFAYYLAVSITNPLDALIWFFVAVIMVIAGTFCLFIAGSVLLCRILQKNKRYYYQPRHFVSVSSMAYRMKRNGAGLASICIISTMILVMLSSSACLYFGAEDGLRARYPRDILSSIDYESADALCGENLAPIRELYDAAITENGITAENWMDYRDCSISGLLRGDTLQVYVDGVNDFSASSYDDIVTVHFVPLEDYNRMYGTEVHLDDDEALIYKYRISSIADHLSIEGSEFRFTGELDSFAVGGKTSANLMPSVFVIVPDLQKTVGRLDDLTMEDDEHLMVCRWYYGFDTDAEMDVQSAVYSQIRSGISDACKAQQYGIVYYECDDMRLQRTDFFSTFGGLFFIGILLSLVFLLAAVVIIYYKQVCEGYEDQARFDIMQRVGMTKKEIRRSINSQMLTVFLLPLVFAALHLGFAFPMVYKLLMLFSIYNLRLFILTTAVSVLVFAAFYAVVYRLTSNAYYGIVSGAKQ